MAQIKISPYGSWKSPVTSDLIVSETVVLGSLTLEGRDTYWIELRPTEEGRLVIIHHSADGQTHEVNPSPLNARTRVHEYGGRAYAVDQGVVYFSNFEDQRLYVVDSPGEAPRPLTPETDLRYADYAIDRARGRMICVREDHRAPGEAVNSLVSLSLAGGDEGQVIVSGNDFYSSPRLSPDGRQLAWLTWNHPNMPWDGTELWLGELDEDGYIAHSELIAGGLEESIFQPQWSPDGGLYFVSDRNGWWNLYRWRERTVEPLYPLEAEFGQPQWVFGMSAYGFASPDRVICSYTQHGASRLASLDLHRKKLEDFDLPGIISFWSLQVAPGKAVFVAGSLTESARIVELDLESRQIEVFRRESLVKVDPGYISEVKEIEFPTENGMSAYGFFYPPRNRDYQAPEGELPPLLVLSHGGPTGATDPSLDLGIQFWTSRGFAVLDVNYGGSTGYGRAYRERLNGQWGVVDVDDCVNGARFLVHQGRVDGNRLAIRGGSAGGYTTLSALAFRDVFKAGASHFGIGDLETFVKDTHKFESRYLDRLVGPYPERKDLYHDRSAINFVDQLSAPMILFQGLEDKIVPPNQAESMVAAVRARGLPVAYLPFEGEQHGFRKSENIKRALEAELYFYSRVFGFVLADPVEPVQIENL